MAVGLPTGGGYFFHGYSQPAGRLGGTNALSEFGFHRLVRPAAQRRLTMHYAGTPGIFVIAVNADGRVVVEAGYSGDDPRSDLLGGTGPVVPTGAAAWYGVGFTLSGTTGSLFFGACGSALTEYTFSHSWTGSNNSDCTHGGGQLSSWAAAQDGEYAVRSKRRWHSNGSTAAILTLTQAQAEHESLTAVRTAQLSGEWRAVDAATALDAAVGSAWEQAGGSFSFSTVADPSLGGSTSLPLARAPLPSPRGPSVVGGTGVLQLGRAALPAPRGPQLAAPVLTARSSARALFSGHSLMDQPLPDYVQLLADGLGRSLDWERQHINGSTIRRRTDGLAGPPAWDGYRGGANRSGSNLNLLHELRTPTQLGAGEVYDSLVVTERHDLTQCVRYEYTQEYLRHFHDTATERNPSGTTYLYASWLDVPPVSGTTPDWTRLQDFYDYETAAIALWEGVASKMNLTLAEDGRSSRILVLPANVALVDFMQRVVAGQVRGLDTGSTADRCNLLWSDYQHLTPLGAYFMACVQYAALFYTSPVGGPRPAGVAANTAEDMQTIAWNFVRDYYSLPRERVMNQTLRDYVADVVLPAYYVVRPGGAGGMSGEQSYYRQASTSPLVWPDGAWSELAPAPGDVALGRASLPAPRGPTVEPYVPGSIALGRAALPAPRGPSVVGVPAPLALGRAALPAPRGPAVVPVAGGVALGRASLPAPRAPAISGGTPAYTLPPPTARGASSVRVGRGRTR